MVIIMRRYFENAFTDRYTIGFAENGIVYAVDIDGNDGVIAELFSYDSCKGRERFYYRSNKKKIALLRREGKVFELCTEEQLAMVARSYGYKKPNNGWAFEELVAIAHNATRNDRQNLPFWAGGDITCQDGSQRQVKYYAATFATLKELEQFS